jgi:hypothetical protein
VGLPQQLAKPDRDSPEFVLPGIVATGPNAAASATVYLGPAEQQLHQTRPCGLWSIPCLPASSTQLLSVLRVCLGY